MFRFIFCLALACAPVLGGCSARGLTLDRLAVDETLITGSVSTDSTVDMASQPPVDPETVSDRSTIRNAVSSAIVDEIPETGLGWANVETGSRGIIHSLSETRQGEGLCRAFTATREGYSGINLYRGTTCLAPGQVWTMKEFERVE